jgi:hypothetical protein
VFLILHLHASQDLGNEDWVQCDRMRGLNRLIGHLLKRHGSARIVKEDFGVPVSRAAGCADETQQGERNRGDARSLS